MKSAWKIWTILLLATTLVAQTGTPPKSKKTKAVAPTAADIQALKDALASQQAMLAQQQQQLQELRDELRRKDQTVQQIQAAAADATAKADAAASQTADQGQTVTALKSDVTDLKANQTNVALSLQETQKTLRDQFESPLAIHFKGITITPGGFLAAESVYRNRAIGADINTQFNGLNFPGSGQNAMSEFYYSGRQSRISLLAEGKIGEAKMSGYVEADFLSAPVTANNNESNSYSLRQRQAWGQAAFPGWTFTGGQMWSLVTETKKGVDNRSEALPMTIDPQYTVGFSWARQAGVRIVRNFNNRAWLAAAIENPSTTFSATNNASNFALGGAGNASGLYNSTTNYSFNSMPDFILKAAFEPGFGHYEVFGVLSRFRDRDYPCEEIGPENTAVCGTTASTLGVHNDSKNGGGFGANARVTIAKHWDFGIHAMTGEGIGRYGSGQLPDATVNPDGTLAPLRSYQGLVTLEWHMPRFDFYMNGGEEYVKRRWAPDPNNTKTPNLPVGYGAPGFNVSGCYAEPLPGSGSGFGFGGLSSSTCQANTQSLIEGTIGFWIRVHNGPHGRLQFGPQYSYVSRNAWTGTSSATPTYAAPHGLDNMFFTSFRYYLP